MTTERCLICDEPASLCCCKMSAAEFSVWLEKYLLLFAELEKQARRVVPTSEVCPLVPVLKQINNLRRRMKK